MLLPHQKLMYFSRYNGEQKGIIDLDRVQEVNNNNNNNNNNSNT